MFDPWTATFEEAMAEQDRWLQSGNDLESPLGPLFQTNGALEVLKLKSEIESGSGFAVLDAISRCVIHGLVAPDWLAHEFLRRYRVVQQLHVGSWDDPIAFGKPYPKGTNLAARRKARVGRIKVWNAAVKKIHSNPDTPIDKAFFEEIGKPFGFGTTLTEEYYEQAKKMFGYCPKKRWNRPAKHVYPAKFKKTAGLLKKPR